MRLIRHFPYTKRPKKFREWKRSDAGNLTFASPFADDTEPLMRCGKSPAESFARISPLVISARQKAARWAPEHLLAYCGMPELHLPERRTCFPSLSPRGCKRDWNGGGGGGSSPSTTSECKLNPRFFILLFLFRVSHCEGEFERRGR